MPRKAKKTRKKRTPTINYDDVDSDDGEEYIYDEVTGGRMKKPVMSVLNKTKLSKYEMDELFNKLE
jgi:hypothetical protein